MVYMMSLRPQSPMKRSFSDNPTARSCSPCALESITPRNASPSSFYSLGSSGAWLRGNENTPPPLTSRSLLDLSQQAHVPRLDHRSAHLLLPTRNGGNSRPIPAFSQNPQLTGPYSKQDVDSEDVQASTEAPEVQTMDVDIDSAEDDDPAELYDLYDAIRIPLPDGRWSDNSGSEPNCEHIELPVPTEPTPQPFRRWMSTLRRRHVQRRRNTLMETSHCSIDIGNVSEASSLPLRSHLHEKLRRKSDSMSSSMDCITAVKSASITVASVSIAHRSEGGGTQARLRMGAHSSNYSEARKSTDSNVGPLGPIIDESAWLRSLQRRKIVEELLASEESYIGDLKVLINDYFMLLTSVPALTTQTRASIQQNIWQILQLHQDLLGDLHQAVPQADITHPAQQEAYPVTKAKHIRFHSADMMPGRFAEHKATRRLRHSLEIGRSPDRRPRALVTDTKTIGNIAKVFNKHMKRFFTYEEYGAHWTTMSQDLTNMCKGLQGWSEYERGVEALSRVVASENNRDSSSKKALTFADLLIKPIQRVCKYPLLFEDLCRHTPVYDDPEAHAELEKALFRLQETIREVNKAKDDPKTRRLIEISWQLQDRLAFQEQTLSRALVFRLLGHVLVCGVLHVAYHTPERVKGQYMVCVLYKSCLVLATTTRLFTPYTVVASIALANASIEEPDNGRGLQCHTAPFTWKLVFEYGHRLHEVIVSACSSQEEEIWKKRLRERIVCETHDFVEGQPNMQDMFSSLSLDLKSIGPVFGHADNLIRRMSVHRAATLGSKMHMTQVIIKNTQAQKSPEPPPTFAPNSVSRSQSHMSTNHIPTLAPRRAERIRLETALEEIWTKDVLPYPGMANRRVENQIRASANSVMRKLSMASIASNFSRRSPSFSSLSNTRSEDSFGSKVHKISQGNLRARSAADRRPAPAVVDFHNAPAAFLPTDFELQDTRPCGRRRRLANRAAGTERSSDKSTPGKPKRTRRLSSHIISLPRTDPYHRLDMRTTSSSHASNSTVLHTPDASMDPSLSQDGEKLNGSECMAELSSRGASLDLPPAKRFLKSKSRIFKFWM
ncbi:Rho guanyl nucleotide exchange factor [Amniculicola lignicola CBS 123094]|uniref:Rho guanyl nucleotide exchange factor n=1 Tax=Amniculicola lignicola CBS 123094 TaxID=1392246 RepID=A0A6A5X1A5_9PLEO|nr:Rho guanyl nucleotide exchange factor [Amniculicola lignicola CBS 123094]